MKTQTVQIFSVTQDLYDQIKADMYNTEIPTGSGGIDTPEIIKAREEAKQDAENISMDDVVNMTIFELEEGQPDVKVFDVFFTGQFDTPYIIKYYKG